MLKLFIAFLFVLLAFENTDAQTKGMKRVVIKADLHCKSCQNKVEKNIPFEKGVKDLKVDLTAKTITIVFKEDKNNVENLCKAVEKLNIAILAVDGKTYGKTAEACKKGDCCQKKSKCGEKGDCCK